MIAPRLELVWREEEVYTESKIWRSSR